MFIVKRSQTRGRTGGRVLYLYLRDSQREPGGKVRSRDLYLGSYLENGDLDATIASIDKILRKVGYTARQRETICEAVRVRVSTNEGAPIMAAWRDPRSRGS
jgi:hypothetical protein